MKGCGWLVLMRRQHQLLKKVINVFWQLWKNILLIVHSFWDKNQAPQTFAIFGQLTQLIGFDPTSRNIAHEISKRTVAWINSMEDLSGLKIENKEWLDVDTVPSSLKELFTEVGKVYAPALIANAQALENGDEAWETEIDGVTWSQKTFPYQAKCLKWIREEFEILFEEDKAKVLEILDGSGCERLLKS